jgi:hypothetical protein
MAKGFVQGFFKPKNPEKYLGNVNRIIFRSSYELRVFSAFDNEPSILKWGSELFSIPYMSPVDGQVHQYFPDLLVVYKDRAGAIQKMLIEIKPHHETLPPRKQTELAVKTYVVNQAKWQAAEKFCNANGLQFQVLTEKSIFFQGAPKKTKARTPKRK